MGTKSLILVLGTLILFSVASFNINRNLTDSLTMSVDYYSDTQARNLAYSASQIVLSRIANSTGLSFRSASGTRLSLFGGSVSYQTKDTVVSGDSVVQVTIYSTFLSRNSSLTAYVRKPTITVVPAATPPGVKGLVASRGNITTSGNMTVDGRNHDANGNLLGGSTGSWGIWTMGTISQSGASQIGGASSGTNYAPSKPANSNSVKSGMTGTVATTPDEVMGGASGGYPEGTLKEIAQAALSGSQYVTNPSSLSYPLSGVTYVELPAGGTWNGANVNGSGVLVVRNTAGDATIKNLNTGTFKGIIIADNIIHIHTNIIGAVIALSPSTSGHIGNGNGSIRYSSINIQNSATTAASAASYLHSSFNTNYGFGNTRLFLTGWYE